MTLLAIPTNGQTWLICGGRDFADAELFDTMMGQIVQMRGVPSRVVHGAAKGADMLANEWAWRLAIDTVGVAASWSLHGKAAGPIRNQRMLDEYRPHLVIAFPGGAGTADMVRRAFVAKERGASLDVAEIKPRLASLDSATPESGKD